MENLTEDQHGIPALTPEQQARIDALGESANESVPKYGWDDTFQSHILGAILTDKDLAHKAIPHINPGFFGNETHALVAGIVKDFWTKYKAVPERFAIKQELADAIQDRDKAVQIHYLGQLEALMTFYTPGLHSSEYLLDKVKEFARCQAVKMAFKDAVEAVNKKPEDVEEAIKKTLKKFQDLARGDSDKGPKLLSCAELLAMPDGEWLVEDHVPTDCVGLIYGRQGSLKSFYALELALSVACDRMFLGTHPVKAGAVVYIAGEGQSGLKKRVAAWLKHHGYDKPPENFKLIPHRFNFADEAEPSKLLALVQEHEVNPTLVIVDTLARNMIGSENDAQTMSAFIASMDTIREGLDRASVLVVHHSGKDATRGSRGYSSLPAAVDVSFELTRKGDGCEVKCDKQKDAEEIAKYLLTTVKVDLGTDAKGKPVNSLVVVHDAGVAPSADAVIKLEETQEEDDVVGCLPWLEERHASATTGWTRAKVQKELNWTRQKTRQVFERVERRGGSVRFKRFSPGDNAPIYYWRDKTYALGQSGCTTVSS